MNNSDFRKYAHELVDWIADYLDSIAEYPVRSQVEPGDILAQLPTSPPSVPEHFPTIFKDFLDIIIPGMTHWQHPSFFAYFPANSSYPSLLAEMLMSALGAQCMIWQTSPAAAELEERIMEWLGNMLGLPAGFMGVIQDTASTATLCAILSAREKYSGYSVNSDGLYGDSPSTPLRNRGSGKYIVYCSAQTHSSIDKAVRIAGLGDKFLHKISVDDEFAMLPAALEEQIVEDIKAGNKPLCVIATIGTTSSTAVDPLEEIGQIAHKYDIWLHVDAAFAGTALLLPEMRWMSKGMEHADSFVFNPHKWMFTNFDCSAYFVKDVEPLLKTFEIMPEYLKTAEDQRVKNYRDWGIPLGRRFRALKLWFVIRSMGVEGIQERIRNHIAWGKLLESWVAEDQNFELMAPRHLNTVCFRYHPADKSYSELDALNAKLLETLNLSGKLYLTHTKLNGHYTIRLVVGQTYVEKQHIEAAWEMITTKAEQLG